MIAVYDRWDDIAREFAAVVGDARTLRRFASLDDVPPAAAVTAAAAAVYTADDTASVKSLSAAGHKVTALLGRDDPALFMRSVAAGARLVIHAPFDRRKLLRLLPETPVAAPPAAVPPVVGEVPASPVVTAPESRVTPPRAAVVAELRRIRTALGAAIEDIQTGAGAAAELRALAGELTAVAAALEAR